MRSYQAVQPLILLFAFFFFQTEVRGFTPPEYYNSLVAGGGAGFKDGDFNSARFNAPSDIDFDEDGKRLFVADQVNNRIRVIHTDQNNLVETLAGTGKTGSEDGPLSTATFNNPCRIVYIKDSLVVYDDGDHLFRWIGLKTGMVSLLVSAPNYNVSRMLYCPQDGYFYFTDPTAGLLVQVDLQKKTLTNILKKNSNLPNPKAICYLDGSIYIADESLPTVYRIPLDPKKPLTDKTVVLNSIGKGNKIHALSVINGMIYALQQGTEPIAVIYPSPRIVGIPTAFGFLAQTNNAQAEPLVDASQYPFCGFKSSPLEPRKIYLCGMSGHARDTILSLRDYDYADHWGGIDPNDFDYPSQKPPKTYRILVAGDSRVVTSPNVDPKDLQGGGTYLTDTYAKQLEFMLNTQAALNNVDIHFEVLIDAHLDENPVISGNYDMPALAKKYDIDLFLPIASCNYKDYYRRPISSEGIPVLHRDMEFVLKPFLDRLPPGPAGDLYHYVTEKKLAGVDAFYSYALVGLLDDPIARGYFLDMLGKPLDMLTNRLQEVKLSDGTSPKLVFTYIPWDAIDELSDGIDPFLQDLYQKHHTTFIDLKDEFNLLRTAYYPTQQACCDHHYTTYGNRLIAMLLFRHLTQDKIVPFEPSKKQSLKKGLDVK